MSAFHPFDLKSNMDRFIVAVFYPFFNDFLHLKSNMDRFIGEELLIIKSLRQGFKIQYG